MRLPHLYLRRGCSTNPQQIEPLEFNQTAWTLHRHRTHKIKQSDKMCAKFEKTLPSQTGKTAKPPIWRFIFWAALLSNQRRNIISRSAVDFGLARL